MNPDKYVYHLLADVSAITAIIGAGNIYSAQIKQGATYPAIMVETISNVSLSDKDGNNMFRAMVQVNCYAQSYAPANNLNRLVKAAIDRYSGLIHGTSILQIDFEDWRDLTISNAEYQGLHHISADYIIHYLEGGS